MNHIEKLGEDFFARDVLSVAPELPGKKIVLVSNELVKKYTIAEVEAYRGEEDLACHASRGRTGRTEVMYARGGILYVYLIYGMHWMLNIVTSQENNPQAVLIRGLVEISGPGRLTRHLGIDKSYNGESLMKSHRIWIENAPPPGRIHLADRIGIDYAGEPWISKKWRFYL